MQFIVVIDLLARIEVEPALTPCCFGRLSQATDNTCSRPPGSSRRYCCSGVTPKVYLTSKSAALPSGPSVLTMNWEPRRKNRVLMPSYLNSVPLKSPRTVSGVTSCIARS